jgi:hypothetical protein
MSPSHTNKRGVRYRYYVSQAVLQNKPEVAGTIGRVPAAEIEALVIAALHNHLQANGTAAAAVPNNERELINRHVERATLTRQSISLQLRRNVEAPEAIDVPDDASNSPAHPRVTTLTIP